jgi:kumamolisin
MFKRKESCSGRNILQSPRLMALLILLMLVAACSLPGAPSSGNAGQSGTTLPKQPPLPLPADHPVADAPPIKNLPAGQPMPTGQTIQLTFNLIFNDAALDSTIQQIYTPGSPTFHHYLTPQQIRESFGPSNAQLGQVQRWLQQQGYRILNVDPLATAIEVEASVGVIEQSMHLQLEQYRLAGHQFYMQNGTPQLPASIASLVQSVIGLNNFAIPRIWSSHSSLSSQSTQAVTGNQADCSKYGAKQTLTRAKLAAAYQFDQLYRRGFQGQGMSIGIAEFDEPFDPRDVANYAACAGVPAPHVQLIDVLAPTPPGPGQGEAALDIELASSLAPQAQILVYQSGRADVQAMLAVFRRVAADDRVQVFSVSYGTAEDNLSSNEQRSLNQALRLMTAEGISPFIASGDCGAFTERIPNIAVVSTPASTPYAIAVGGTILQINAQNVRTSETAWGPEAQTGLLCLNNWGTGGGVDQNLDFQRPSWQVGSGLNTHYDGTAGHILTPALVPVEAPNGLRQVPDVAAAAYNIASFWRGQWWRVGGTSAAAPIWAAGTVLVDQGLRAQHRSFLGGVPTLYTLANQPGRLHPFTDIVVGNNGFYRATPGWDYTTGWGSPNFYEILQRAQQL